MEKFSLTTVEISDKAIKKKDSFQDSMAPRKMLKRCNQQGCSISPFFLPFPSIIVKMNSSQYQPVAWPSPSLSSKADFVAALPLPRLLRDLMPAWLEEEHRSSGAQVTLGAVEDDNTQRSRCSKKLLRMPWCLLSTAIKLSCCLPRLLKALH